MAEIGVLDPTKVTRYALQNAASVAGLMLITECMVAAMHKEEAGDMGGMMYFPPASLRQKETACRSAASDYEKPRRFAGLFFGCYPTAILARNILANSFVRVVPGRAIAEK